MVGWSGWPDCAESNEWVGAGAHRPRCALAARDVKLEKVGGMHETCLDIDRRPFGSVPQVDHYYGGTVIEDARATLSHCIEQGQGAGMVVGPAGTGKTLLCRVLAEQFKDAFEVAVLSGGRLSSRRALLQAILHRLGRPYRDMDEGELRLALEDHLTTPRSNTPRSNTGEDCPGGMLLLVDDAHTLPLRLLDEIRMLTDVAAAGRPLVRAVLAGGSSLEERFANPKLESFSQRLVARCYLESFNRTETQEYIHARIIRVGSEAVFSTEACEAVYRATDGVPRLINQVCEHALLLAQVAGCEQVEPTRVQEAWADLQQLPTPWSGEEATGETGVIEFGDLDDVSEETDELDAEESPAQTLRISPDLDEPDALAEPPDALAEPDEQLDRIEGMLVAAGGDLQDGDLQDGDLQDDNFRPAGTIGPELELSFPDPFDEEFEEEEMVAPLAAVAQSPAELPAVEEEGQPREETASIEFGDLDLIDTASQRDAVPRPVFVSRGRQYARLFATLRQG